MASIWDYPVTQGYGYDPSYPLNGGQHRGIDYGASLNTPVTVNGVTIGLSGMTGASTGPHTHVGKWQGSQVLDPGTQGGKTLTSPKVIFTGSDSTNGNYIKLESQGYQWVYLHLNQINVKVGDIIGGGMTQDAIEKLVSKIYRVATDIDATPEQANYWVERIKADNNTAYELPVALGADDYKGDDMFRYKGRHYSEDMTTAKKQAYDQGLADGGGEATVLTPGKYQVK